MRASLGSLDPVSVVTGGPAVLSKSCPNLLYFAVLETPLPSFNSENELQPNFQKAFPSNQPLRVASFSSLRGRGINQPGRGAEDGRRSSSIVEGAEAQNSGAAEGEDMHPGRI